MFTKGENKEQSHLYIEVFYQSSFQASSLLFKSIANINLLHVLRSNNLVNAHASMHFACAW
jgi:hypothetical protein